MKTILHAYKFDISRADEREAWKALKGRLLPTHPVMGPVFSDYSFHHSKIVPLDGCEVTLETTHLFDNQWNTAPTPTSEKGLRVFDFERGELPGNRSIRFGHWLEQTEEMKEARRNTNKCGYCGVQQPAAKGDVFCPHCLDSEYLTEKDLHLTRMTAVDEGRAPRAPLTDAERAYLLPLFRDAQVHGQTERGKRRIANMRERLAAKKARAIENATTEHDGMIWLLDHAINTDNVIYYDHTGVFCFGWRHPLDESVRDGLLEVISEFRFPYQLKCADGRTLEGNIG